MVDDAEISEIQKHLQLSGCEIDFAVTLAELQAAKHKEEREDIDLIHAKLLCTVEIENEDRPDLRIDLLQDKRESFLSNTDTDAFNFDQATVLQQVLDRRTESGTLVPQNDSSAADHVAQNTLPLAPRELVELIDGYWVLTSGVPSNAKGFVVSGTGQGLS